MFKKRPVILATILIALIFSLLFIRRFDMPEQLKVTVTDTQGNSEYSIGDILRRGSMVSSGNSYLHTQFGEDIFISLDRNTAVELENLETIGPVIRLLKGRILVKANETPVWITTNTTENTVALGSATFVNYDFLETINIIPIDTSVLTTIKTTGDYMLLPVPIAVKEGNEPGYETLEVNLEASEVKTFYDWCKDH